MEANLPPHTPDEVYTRLGTVEREVAGLTAKLDSVLTSLDRIARRNDQPFNYIGFGSLIVAVLLYMQTTLDPVAEKADLALAQLQERQALVFGTPPRIHAAEDRIANQDKLMTDFAQRLARAEGKTELADSLLIRLEEFSRSAAYIHGQREALENRVNDIDNLGSRYWKAVPNDTDQRKE